MVIHYERLQSFSSLFKYERRYIRDGSFLDKLCIFGNRDATSAPNTAAFCRFRKEREWLISSRLDLWLSVIFIKTIPDWLDK